MAALPLVRVPLLVLLLVHRSGKHPVAPAANVGGSLAALFPSQAFARVRGGGGGTLLGGRAEEALVAVGAVAGEAMLLAGHLNLWKRVEKIII